MTTETSTAIDFVMHPELLRSVIQRQAGSLSKAVLEAVMNSIDAGATRIDVDFDANYVTIKDDGKGFADANEIHLFFKTFGQPHTEGDAVYGKFRMGRGQMFAFGRNTWRTGTFQMDVDIEKKLGFDLQENLPNHKGCDIRIDLFKPMNTWDSQGINREIQQYVKYVEIPVYLNGIQINKVPDKAKFPDSIDVAWINTTASGSGVQVYNLGVYVCTIPSSRYGVSGTVVSRKQLTVNFARNAIMENDCEVWKLIKAVLRARGRELVDKKPILNDGERLNVIERIVAGEYGRDTGALKVLVDTTGKAWSANAVVRGKFDYWTFAKANDPMADNLMQVGTAIVFDEEWLREFGVEPDQVIGKMISVSYNFPQYKKFEDLTKGKQAQYKEIPSRDYTARERVWLELLNNVYYAYRRVKCNWRTPNRKLKMGLSNSALAWTDGKSTVYFERNFLKEHPLTNSKGEVNMNNVTEVCQTLVHELCHETESIGIGHPPEFYRAYHDDSMLVLGPMIAEVVRFLNKYPYADLMERAKKKSGGVDADAPLTIPEEETE